jgi:hypothetical protein
MKLQTVRVGQKTFIVRLLSDAGVEQEMLDDLLAELTLYTDTAATPIKIDDKTGISIILKGKENRLP